MLLFGVVAAIIASGASQGKTTSLLPATVLRILGKYYQASQVPTFLPHGPYGDHFLQIAKAGYKKSELQMFMKIKYVILIDHSFVQLHAIRNSRS